MARNTTKLTLKATGEINKASLTRLQQVIDLQRELYNHALSWLKHRPETDFNTLRDLLRKELTQLRKEDANYRNIFRKISYGTIERAIINHLRHTAPAEGSKPAGKPRQKSPERFRTITLLSPTTKVTFLNSTNSNLKPWSRACRPSPSVAPKSCRTTSSPPPSTSPSNEGRFTCDSSTTSQLTHR